MKGGLCIILVILLSALVSTAVFAQTGPPVPPPPPAQEQANETTVQETNETAQEETYILTILKTGSGTVTEIGNGLNCGPDCTLVYDAGTALTLKADPNGGSEFLNWEGDCAGSGQCILTMDSDKTVTAVFIGKTADAIEPVTEKPETKSNTLLYIGVALVVVLLGGFAVLKMKKTPAQNPQAAQLRNYITENLAKGYSREQLTNILLQSGYSQQMIDEAMKGV